MWKQMQGVAPHYMVSDSGEGIKNSQTGRILRYSTNPGGYPQCGLLSDDKRKITVALHRVVALAFIPNPDGVKVVRHKSSDKTNFKASNLCWGTHADNMNDIKVSGSARAGAIARHSAKAECIKVDLSTLQFLHASYARNPEKFYALAGIILLKV